MSTSGLKFDTIIFLSGVDFMRFAKMSGNFWLYFYCACTETAIHELSVNILTPAFNSSTPVFCLRKAIFRRLEDILVYISTNKMVAGHHSIAAVSITLLLKFQYQHACFKTIYKTKIALVK